MIDESKLVALVDRATKQTRAGRMSWQPTFSEDRFITMSEQGGLLVEHACEPELGDGGTPVDWYDLSVLNPDGYTAAKYSTAPHLTRSGAELAPAGSQIGELFRAARERAVGGEDVIEALLDTIAT